VVDWHDPGRGRSADPVAGADPDELGLLLDHGPDADLRTAGGLRDFLASRAMRLITDRGDRSS
jgi:hypothetical protein